MGVSGDLWGTSRGSARWLDLTTPEQKQWLDDLADLIVKRGSEPVWAQVGKRFRQDFDLDLHPVDTTVMSTVRYLVEHR